MFYKTILSILADFSNAVVLMVLARPPIPILPVPLQVFGVYQWQLVTFVSHKFLFCFVFFMQGPSFFLSFRFLLFLLSSPPGQQSPFVGRFLFVFLYYYSAWSSDRDYVICLSLKISENFNYFILQDRFFCIHIPIFRRFKFKFLAQFAMDNLSYPVVCNLKTVVHVCLRLWCK